MSCGDFIGKTIPCFCAAVKVERKTCLIAKETRRDDCDVTRVNKTEAANMEAAGGKAGPDDA
jgi:hypothetical protein